MVPDRRPVELRGVPAGWFLDLLGYFDDVTRELRLIQLGAAPRDEAAPGDGVDLAEEVTFTHKDTERIRRLLHRQAKDAVDRGRVDTDLTIDLELAAASDAHDLEALLTRMNTASRHGRLLTPPVGDRPLGLLAWMVDQVDRQLITGEKPRPFGT